MQVHEPTVERLIREASKRYPSIAEQDRERMIRTLASYAELCLRMHQQERHQRMPGHIQTYPD